MNTIIISVVLIIITSIILKKIFSGGKNTLKTDMKGKIVIITGASSGLGFYHAKNMLESNATVIFACRSEERAEKAIESLNKLEFILMQSDLTSHIDYALVNSFYISSK